MFTPQPICGLLISLLNLFEDMGLKKHFFVIFKNNNHFCFISLQKRNETMTNLFIYGTLQEPQIQEYLFGKIVDMIPARLQFYTIKNAISDGVELPYKTIVPVPNESSAVVHGHIIILNDEQMERVDAYEGYPTLYLKTNVVVEDSDSIAHLCISYINTPYFSNKVFSK